MPKTPPFTLPRSGLKREALRKKGQFWTPDWTADIMAAYVLQSKPAYLFDPTLGEGVFFRAAKRYAHSHDFDLTLVGCDINPAVIAQARLSGLDTNDLRHVDMRDFGTREGRGQVSPSPTRIPRCPLS